MIEIKIYTNELKSEWDDFVSSSKNGTFLLKRDFMEYHSLRFHDHSLLFYAEDKLVALLPAHRDEDKLCSHLGLTYAGLITSRKTTTSLVLHIFENLTAYLKTLGIKKFIYKTIPYIYHNQAAEEDLYALFRFNARLTSCAISSCIYMDDKIKFARDRRRAVKKAIQNNLTVEEADNFRDFWELLTFNLNDRYKTDPVHTIEEIEYLKSKFPDNIRLFQSKNGDELLAGTLIFVMGDTVHPQYISSNAIGRSQGAVDIIFSHLIENVYPGKKYFDFGISTENGGRYLNEGLISQKEGFGGRGVVYNTYEIDI